MKPIAFFDAQSLQKQAKQTGVSCVAENIVGSLCVLYYVFGVFVPLRNTKKLPNKQKQLIKTKTRSHAKTKASLADIFPFLLNTEPGPRLPS